MNEVLIKEEKKGFTIIQNEFLQKWVKEIGIGPAMLYLQLLSYCYGEKDMAYPSLNRLANTMGVSVKTIVVYRKILVSYGLIKKIIRRKDEHGSYQSSLYQLVKFDDRVFPEEEINEDEKVISGVVDATREDSQNFRDTLDNKEDSLLSQLKELGITNKGINRLLQSYPKDKINSKLYLLREKKIHNPGAYLLSVLRNDYAGKDTYHPDNEITSTEIDEINRRDRNTRRRYYQKMEENALPKQESLKCISEIKEQLRDGKMSSK